MATVSGTGLVTGVGAGRATITLDQSGAERTSGITVRAAGSRSPHPQCVESGPQRDGARRADGRIATFNNPDAIVTWGGESDPAPATPRARSSLRLAVPERQGDGVADGAGVDSSSRVTDHGVNVVYVQVEMSFGSGADAPNESGNFKSFRTREAGYDYMNGSLIVQQNEIDGFFDDWAANPSMHTLVPDVTVNNDGTWKFDTLKVRFEADATPPSRCGSTGRRGDGDAYERATRRPPEVTSIVELSRRSNSVGGIRQVDRVSIDSQDIPAFP